MGPITIYVVEPIKIKDEEEGKAEIIVAKQRNGPTGKISASFISQYARFENLSSESTPF